MPVFYRVVSRAEYNDIASTGHFRPGPNTMDGKHLWSTVEEAQEFLRRLYRLGWESECIILMVEVTEVVARSFEPLSGLDGIGPGWFVNVADLKGATVRIVE